MKKYNLNKYTLRYFNSSYEKEFNEKDAIKKYKLQLAIAIYYTIMNSIYLGVDGFDLNLILYTIMLLIFIILVHQKKILVYYTNILIILATQFSYLIYIKEREGQISAGEIFINGQAVSSLFLLSSQSFYFDAITMIICQAMLRYMMQTLSYLNLLDAFQIIFINSTFKYLQQRQERQTFFEKKKAEQWNLCTDNLFQNTVVLTKYDKVTCKVCVQDCNYQARKLKIYDDDSFEEFSQTVKIDLSKSKISFLLSNEKNTLKDYLLLKHYLQSNLKKRKAGKIPNQIQSQSGSSQQDTNQQESKKVTQQNIDGSTSIKYAKHDVLYVTYENPKCQGEIKRMKIKAGTLELDYPFIILSMQDVSSQTNLSNLKIKSTKNDLIYIKSINEIRDKVVKIISQITSSRFSSQKNETNSINQQNQRRVSNEEVQLNGFITYKKQRSFYDQREQNQTNKQNANTPVNNTFLNVQDQITFQAASENYSQQNCVENKDEKDSKNIKLEGNDNNNQSPLSADIYLNKANLKKEIKQLQQNSKQQDEQIKYYNQQQNFILQQKNISTSIYQKTNQLLLPPQSEPLISQFSQRISDFKEKDELSDIASEYRSQKLYQQNNNQNNKILKKSSFNNSYYEGDSIQLIENDEIDYKISSLKLGLSCLLNNTYSLLDYIILSNEKSHFKKLIVKPNSLQLRKLEQFLKQLFPNLKVTYQTQELQDKELKTDIRRLKYILISIISSYFYRKKELDAQFNNPIRNHSNTFMILTDQLNQTVLPNKTKQLYKYQQQIHNLEYDKQIEILLNISINEQPHFTSISFSVQNFGSINLQPENSLNIINSPKVRNISDTCIPISYTNKIAGPEKFTSFMSKNMCINGTCDLTIREMEIRNIYFNIMRLGPYMPEYDSSLNLFQFDIFENIDVIEQIPSATNIQTTQTNIMMQPTSGFNVENSVKQTNGVQLLNKINLNLAPQFSSDNQSTKHRKSNFFQQGAANLNITFPNGKSQDVIRKKSAQRSKFNSNESVFSKKKIPLDEFKQQAIERIKENIQSFDGDFDIGSYITFSSGNEQKMEEHMEDSLYISKKLPKSFWDIVQSEEIQQQI
ncbi:transmembrane protein, putative (macronuclear) [Tetrahymena thermophila SB210]|uniref:Transmembrane protein, putative n=1 Tax=Tetrahymena thermophila (strain SB210) TaxID=312017 RepID=I7M6V3_TETTS|nr:transmembrane protein, putative [Tetrahymena thermophila SB210]EAR87324.2 transmembrane protein, putative [Tetrahymena thermophila SB210]|eukprot:XP_001007569.2 transmembrane protein, putative [Tetrahymena thermophila SB210]